MPVSKESNPQTHKTLLISDSYTKHRINVSEKHIKVAPVVRKPHRHTTSRTKLCVTLRPNAEKTLLIPIAGLTNTHYDRKTQDTKERGASTTTGQVRLPEERERCRFQSTRYSFRAEAQLGLTSIWQISLFNVTLIPRRVKSLILLADADCICLTSEACWLTVLMHFLMDEKGNDSFWLTFKHISSL